MSQNDLNLPHSVTVVVLVMMVAVVVLVMMKTATLSETRTSRIGKWDRFEELICFSGHVDLNGVKKKKLLDSATIGY